MLFVINSCTAPILFLKEFTFSAPIVTFLAFCSLCQVTDGKSFLILLYNVKKYSFLLEQILYDLVIYLERIT